MMEISKELLSEVLEYKVYDYTLKDTKIKINKITASTLCNEPRIIGYEKGINIYELAHKCKVWAHNKGYMLNTVILTADNKTWYCEDDYRKTRTTWKDDSEPLVIFKACEWILNNKPL